MKTTFTTLMLSIVLCTAGCLGVAQTGDDDEVGAVQSALTRSGLTDQNPWVIGFHAGGHGCSGSVLSSRWILTAAHCVQVTQGSTINVTVAGLPAAPGAPVPIQHLYDGPARYFPHPGYDRTCPLGVCVDLDSDDDIGLVYLTGTKGIDLATSGQARLFDDDEEPYHGSGNRYFHIMGYGRGTDPGGSDDCDDGQSRGKRVGYGFQIDVSSDDYQGHGPYGGTHPCPGDSGGPWLFARGPAGAKLDLVFGVMSGLRIDTLVTSPKMWSALVKPRRQWIEQTSAGTDHKLTCRPFSVGSWQYRRCDEPPVFIPIPVETRN